MTRYTLIFLTILLLGLVAYFVNFDIDCSDKGGKTVRGLFWVECITKD